MKYWLNPMQASIRKDVTNTRQFVIKKNDYLLYHFARINRCYLKLT